MANRILVMVMLVGLLMGCMREDPLYEEEELKYNIVCIDNVEYIYLDRAVSYMTPHLKTDGKPYLCEGNDNGR